MIGATASLGILIKNYKKFDKTGSGSSDKV